MVLINYAGREINAKIVYYGPGLSGKTTNLECIYASVPQQSRGKMVSMKTRQDRTLFFDFLPLELGEVHGFRTRFLLYTVPGQVFYNATRKLVLKGADAVVFVADSGLGKMEENLESLRNLEENLREQGLSVEHVPWVIQYNKRDLPEVYAIDELQAALNPRGVPFFEAAAASGHGVYETLHAVSRLLFQKLMSELRPAAGRAPAPNAAASAPPRAVATATPPPAAAWSGPRGGGAPEAPAAAPREVPSRRAYEPARAVATEPNPRSMAPAVETAYAPQPLDEPPAGESAAPQIFGAPTSRVPTAPTPAQILDTVQATARALGEETPAAVEPGSDYESYGHIVDLSVDLGETTPPTPPGNFIKDPLRRSTSASAPATRGRQAPPGMAPLRTQHVSVSISRSELQQGGIIRLVVDLKIEA